MYSLALIGRDGSVMKPETQINATVSGSAYDPYFADGPTLWVIDQSQREDIANPYDQAVIRRVDLETLQVAEDHAYGCEQLPGYVHGTPWVSTWGTGLFGSTDYVDGHFVLMGAIVSDPGLAFVLDMYELPGWFSLDTMRVEIPANGNYTLDYHVNTADLLDGDQRHVKVTARMDPGLDVLEYDFTLTVDGHAEYAKPLDLTVDVVDDSAARLAWKAPQADNDPLRYRVYRNGLVVDSVEGLAYEDPYLKAGVYEYAVSAVYAGGHESALSRSVEIEIYVGVACYAPKNLTAVNVMNRAVALSWLDPSATGTEPAVLRWGNGFHDDGISLSSGGSFIGAARWEPADLADYREMPLESVSFFAVSEGTYVLKIYEDGTLVHEQPIEDYAIGNFTEVVLDEEYIINDRVELTVGIEATPSAAGGLLLGIDAGPAVDGKGNVVYVEGLGWSTLLALGGSDANFNIEMNLGAKENPGTGELTADGFTSAQAGAFVTTLLIASIAGSFAQPALSRLCPNSNVRVFLSVAAFALPVLFLERLPLVLTALAAGFAQGIFVAESFAMPAKKTDGFERLVALTGRVQCGGYVLAGVGPFLTGGVVELLSVSAVPTLLTVFALLWGLFAVFAERAE